MSLFRGRKTSFYTYFVMLIVCLVLVVIFTRVPRPTVRTSAIKLVRKDTSTTANSDTATKGNVPFVACKAKLKPLKRKDVKVRGLYLTGWTAGSAANLRHYVRLAMSTEINAYVIDIKDDDGFVGYKSAIPAVNEVKGWIKKYNAERALKAFHDSGIYVIGRVVCFKDPVLASRKLDLAIKSKKGGVWRDPQGRAWLNPYDKNAWAYIVEVAKEGLNLGFDEIQLDYVRFANDGDTRDMDFSAYKEKRYEIINQFLAYVRKELPGAKLSADVFGIICESPADVEGIGQNLEFVGRDIDYLSPMVYPSHYALNQTIRGVSYPKPDTEPYAVVYNSLAKARGRIDTIKGYKATLRPYLQDFTARWIGKGNYMHYGARELRQQIQAVYDAGYSEWLVWNAANRYSESAFRTPVDTVAATQE